MYMVDKTGTFWEHIDDSASCNHGFGAHIVYWIYKNVLGIKTIDSVKQRIRIRFDEVDSDWCEGRIPLGKEFICLRWWKEKSTLFYSIDIPAGYTLEVENWTDYITIHR